MNFDFISERACQLHREYLQNLKLKYSVLEKSFPEIVGKTIFDIRKSRVKYKDEILDLKCDILCHELFFNSFGKKNQTSVSVRRSFGSEARLLYEIYEAGMGAGNCFAIISRTKKGEVEFNLGAPSILIGISAPILAIDLCEHSYFLDFGFDKEKYLSAVLPHLNLNKLT